MNKNVLLLVLVMLLGFGVGLVIGYFGIGITIENQCLAALESYEGYIGRYCPIPADNDFTYINEEVAGWIKNFTT